MADKREESCTPFRTGVYCRHGAARTTSRSQFAVRLSPIQEHLDLSLNTDAYFGLIPNAKVFLNLIVE